jgi:hypothetical protein
MAVIRAKAGLNLVEIATNDRPMAQAIRLLMVLTLPLAVKNFKKRLVGHVGKYQRWHGQDDCRGNDKENSLFDKRFHVIHPLP